MTEIIWSKDNNILIMAAERSLNSVQERIVEEDPDWVVLVRTFHESAQVYYYAFNPSELEYLINQYPDRMNWPIELAIGLHEGMSSSVSHKRRFQGSKPQQLGPTNGRVVDFDAVGRIVAVGQWEDIITYALAESNGNGGSDDFYHIGDLGPMRGGNSGDELNSYLGSTPREQGTEPEPMPPVPPAPVSEIEVTLSAETKNEIQVGTNEVVKFRIELSSEATPLAVSQTTKVEGNISILVSLLVEKDIIEIVQDQEYLIKPPTPKKPRTGFFKVKGVHTGVSRLAVTFHQGGTELGVIGFAVEVVEASAKSELTQNKVVAVERDIADDDKILLLIKQITEGGHVFYDYFLHSEGLGLIHSVRSKPLLDRGNGPAASTLAFVERVYERVTKELKSFDDIKLLKLETRALGANLCQELFDPAVTKILWPLRNQIKLINVISWEPYIPWELVCLRDPESGDIDDHFLAEYGLIRTLSDDMPPRTLTMANWSYLGATFTRDDYPSVGAELDYFTGTSPESLRGQGITPTEIDNTRDAFYDALAESDFDVLHISCHAESKHQSIERSSLIIGDEIPPGDNKPRLVEVDAITVEAEARLKQRRPLVFLNACETGRVGAVLTAWGGWPNVFLRRGAGVFVGSSWAVRDKPAAVFSTAFYNALLDGKTLAEATSLARAAAKKMGDASWLAFKVYGHPNAKRVPARLTPNN